VRVGEELFPLGAGHRQRRCHARNDRTPIHLRPEVLDDTCDPLQGAVAERDRLRRSKTKPRKLSNSPAQRLAS
jgi:hypothetical protein